MTANHRNLIAIKTKTNLRALKSPEIDIIVAYFTTTIICSLHSLKFMSFCCFRDLFGSFAFCYKSE